MTKNINEKDNYGYNFISIHSQLSQLRYSDLPLWLSIVVHLDGVFGQIKRANRFLLCNLIPTQMTKNNGIKASAKRSNTSFTSSHETANPQLTIDPLLAQILHHATMLSAITYDKKEYLKKFNDYYEHLERKMVEISNLAGDIMIQVGEAIGMDIADQGFDNTKLYR